MKCKAMTLFGKQCTIEASIDGYCLQHWKRAKDNQLKRQGRLKKRWIRKV